MELVHAHLARRPQPPEDLNGRTPALLSRIVLKLLEKEPERRYQTAYALWTDLCAAQMEWQRHGVIEAFTLAQRDVASTLRIGDTLYGREQEIELLQRAYNAAAAGHSAFVVVTGPAGIGKSALVKQLQRHVMASRGLFIFGKFDQLHRGVPYSGLVEAFRMLVRQLLTESDDVLAAWRERILTAVAPNGSVLIEVIPELERVLGAQPAVVEMGPVEARNRFNLAFSALLHVFASADHPLALFLDDLQWVDAASLSLLQQWIEDTGNAHLLLLGSYRDREVDLTHPLALCLRELRQAGRGIPEIKLGPLTVDDVAQLLADTLRADLPRTRPFAQRLVDKTAGNSFFVRRLLHTLHAEKILYFVPETSQWNWSLEKVAHIAVGDNVLDLMVGSIQDLPAATTHVLQAAACIGHRFDLRTLAEVTEQQRGDVARHLWPALEDGLLVPLRETSKAPDHPETLDAALRDLPSTVMFVHDRVQQAAYSLLSEERRQQLHLTIGRRLLLGVAADKLEERLFDVVDHLNMGEALIVDADERLRLSQLNLAAGRKAKASAAYQAAFDYITVGRRHVPDTEEVLAFDLIRELAECAYLTGRHSDAERIVQEALACAPSVLAKMELYMLCAQAATVAGDYAKALAQGREGLSLLGMAWPLEATALDAAIEQEVAEVQRNLAGQNIEALAAAPEVQIEEICVAMHLLSALGPPAYFHDGKILAYCCARATHLSLVHGPSPYSAYGYALYAPLYNRRTEDCTTGYAIGRLALALARRFGNRAEESRTLEVYGLVVHVWKEPLRHSIDFFKVGYHAGLEAGELQYAALNLTSICINGLPLGMHLQAYEYEVDASIEFSRKHHNKNSYELSVPYRQALRCLAGRTTSADSFDDEEFTEAQFIADAQDNITALAFYGSVRTQVHYLNGNPRAARASAKWALPYVPLAMGMIIEAEHAFYSALASAALCATAPAAERAELLEEVQNLCLKLRKWAHHCPANFSHKEFLLRAELAQLNGDKLAAMTWYREAIAGATREGFVQDRALAEERLGELYLADGDITAASAYLSLARDSYQKWGAVRVVRRLQQNHDAVLVKTKSLSDSHQALDTLGLMKASQAIAAETLPERLVERILQIMVQVAGAEGGSLLVHSPTGLMRRGHFSPGGSITTPRVGIPLDECVDVPHAIVRYVDRLKEPLVLADAAAEGLFAANPEVQRLHLRSVLCVPLLRQADVMGILCLTNNSMASAFTAERSEVVRVLAAQAVISLERSEFLRERERAERAQRFLANASAALIESLDQRTTLARVAREAVPAFADWCILSLVGLGETGNLVEVVHANEEQAALAAALRQSTTCSAQIAERSPSKPDAEARSLLFESVTPEQIRNIACNEDHFDALTAIKPRSIISAPLHARGHNVGVLTFILTEGDRRYDAADRDLVEELAKRCALAVDNARLYKEAQQAVQVREEFISIASHELKTPLTPLQLQIQALERRLPALLEETEANSWVRDKLMMLRRQGQRLERLVNELLDISRLSAGYLDLELDQVEMMALVKDVVTRFEESGEIDQAGSQVVLNVGEPIEGHWDRLRVEQVVTNLLSNALKYGRRRPVTVTVRRHESNALLEVVDQGIGIAHEHLDRIFGRFERAVSARHYGGLGLGLYIVSQIVRAMGGSIHVSSTAQEGSTFIATFPIAGPAHTRR